MPIDNDLFSSAFGSSSGSRVDHDLFTRAFGPVSGSSFAPPPVPVPTPTPAPFNPPVFHESLRGYQQQEPAKDNSFFDGVIGGVKSLGAAAKGAVQMAGRGVEKMGVDLPEALTGENEFDQLRKPAERTIPEQFMSAAAYSAPAGLADITASGVESAGLVRNRVESLFSGVNIDPQTDPAYQDAAKLKGFAQESRGYNPDADKFIGQATEATAQTGIFIAAQLFGGTAASALTGASTMFAPTYDEAKKHGADEGTALLAATLGGAIGAAESFFPEDLVGRLSQIPPEGRSKLLQLAVSFAEEGGTEGLQSYASDLVALLYDPNREIGATAGQETILGGTAGAVLESVFMPFRSRGGFHMTEAPEAVQPLSDVPVDPMTGIAQPADPLPPQQVSPQPSTPSTPQPQPEPVTQPSPLPAPVEAAPAPQAVTSPEQPVAAAPQPEGVTPQPSPAFPKADPELLSRLKSQVQGNVQEQVEARRPKEEAKPLGDIIVQPLRGGEPTRIKADEPKAEAKTEPEQLKPESLEGNRYFEARRPEEEPEAFEPLDVAAKRIREEANAKQDEIYKKFSEDTKALRRQLGSRPSKQKKEQLDEEYRQLKDAKDKEVAKLAKEFRENPKIIEFQNALRADDKAKIEQRNQDVVEGGGVKPEQVQPTQPEPAVAPEGDRKPKPKSLDPTEDQFRDDLTFDEVQAEYDDAFAQLQKYTIEQIGHQLYASRLGELEDKYPDFVEKIEAEKFKGPGETAPQPESGQNLSEPSSDDPRVQIQNEMAERFGKGESFDNPKLNEIRNRVHGKLLGNARETYDAVEAGFNKHLEKSGVVDFSKPEETVDRLLEETNKLPRQTVRDERQIELQQFSTPPALGFVAAKAAGIQKGMTVLEPSAGTGNLATLARIAGAETVHANEIDAYRKSLLEDQGFQTSDVTGEQLHNMLDESVQPDVIVMNPPFSATGGRVKSHDNKFGYRHIEQALARLKPGGRLVAIMGRGAALDRPKARVFWAKMFRDYKVRANVSMDGKFYGKYGTTFDNQLIVIDKIGPTEGSDYATKAASVITGDKALSPKEALSLLGELSKENIGERIREAAGTEGKETGVHGPRGEAPTTPVDSKDAGRRGDATEAGTPRGVNEPVVAADAAPPSNLPTDKDGDRQGETGTPQEGQRGKTEPVGARSDTSGGQRTDASGPNRVEIEKPKAKEKIEAEGDTFSRYRVQKARIKGAQKHPAALIESATMASVEPPDTKYQPHLPKEVIEEGRLSDVQLEAITYAGQRHQGTLPNGQRAGYWVGDGTGVGKGRTIYGIIYDNFMQGRKKAVHISITKQLHEDAKRDAEGVGLPIPVINHDDNAFKKNAPITQEEGVLFTTYPLAAHGWKSGKKRFQQIVDWLGPDFDGVIAFDEAHKMKNAVGTGIGGGASDKNGSDQGDMGIALQKQFPNARIVYVSATGATNARNMAYMNRLGLWGDGAPFSNFMDFLTRMQSLGVASLEMLSRDLKAVGSFASRTISFKGEKPGDQVEYATIEHKLEPAQQQQYDLAADLWADIALEFEEANDRNSDKGKGLGSAAGQFYNSQQRFFLQVMTSFQLKALFANAKADLDSGKSIVISLYDTNEGKTVEKAEKALAEGIDLEDLDFTPRELLVGLVEKHFPIYQMEEFTDPDTGKKDTRPFLDKDGNKVINKESASKQRELLDKVADLNLPDNPLDAIVNHFGPQNVAEISGRSKRLEGSKLVTRKIKGVSKKKLNSHETALFQEGKKRIAIISGAGATGISLHADRGAKNQDRRVFYAMQLSWSADTQMQSFGRVHRSNQTSYPEIKMITVNLAGQKRLTNAVSARLASLGAITKGGREALGGGIFDVEDITDEHGQAALRLLYSRLTAGTLTFDGIANESVLKRMGVLSKSGDVKENAQNNVNNFLNRIMALPSSIQRTLFDEFYQDYKTIVQRAKDAGSFDAGVEKIDAKNITVDHSDVVFTDPASGAETKLYEISGDFKTERMTAKEAMELNGFQGFVKNKRSGNVRAVQPKYDPETLNMQHPTIIGWKLQNPNKNATFITPQEMQKWERLTREEGAALWADEYKALPATQTQQKVLLSGAVFPIFDKVVGGDSNFTLKVKRAELADGDAIVGIEIPQGMQKSLKQRLGVGAPLAEMHAEDVFALVLEGGIIELDNGWRLQKVTVQGETRVELDTRGAIVRKELIGFGLVEEVLNYKRRFFVPSDTAGPIRRLLKQHKPIRDLTAKDGGAKASGGGGGGAQERAQSRGTDVYEGSIYWDRDGRPIKLASMEGLRGLEMPELVKLAEDVSGSRPQISKLRGSRGTFKAGQVKLDASIFDNPEAASLTLAHEIGHLADWLPDQTLTRGNLLGRLNSLTRYMKREFGGMKATDPEIRAELQAWTHKWKPFDAGESESYTKYRYSAKELYADALSGLLVAPGLLQKEAPKFYQAFFAGIEKKPLVERAYNEVQELLGRGEEEVVAERRKNLVGSFAAAEDRRRELEAKTERTMKQYVEEVITNSKVHFSDKNAVILSNLTKFVDEKGVADNANPRYLLEEAAMADAKNHKMMVDIVEEVVNPFVETSGLAEAKAREMFGEYLFNTRIQNGDRSELANPQGITPEGARKNLEAIRRELGDDSWYALKRSMDKFHDMAFEMSRQATEAGVYSQKQFSEIIEPNRKTYATFEVVDFMDTTVASGISSQRGTFKDIANPFTSSLLKMATLNRAVAYNRAKSSVRDVWIANGLGIRKSKAIRVVDRDTGKTATRFETQADDELSGIMEVMEDGKVVGYDIDPYVATAFKKLDPAQLMAFMGALSRVNSKIFHPLFITLNASFHVRNFVRDQMRNWKNGTTLREIVENAQVGLGAGHARAMGRSNPILSEMTSQSALDIPFTQSEAGLLEEDTFERMIAKMAVGDTPLTGPKQGKVARVALAPYNFMKYIGDVAETFSKVTAYNARRKRNLYDIAEDYRGNHLRGLRRVQVSAWLNLERDSKGHIVWTDAKRAKFIDAMEAYVFHGKMTQGIPKALAEDYKKFYQRRMDVDGRRISYETRNFSGTPNWRKRGHSTYITNALFLYSNVAIQGYKADYEVATDAKTAGGFWLKAGMVSLIPALLKAAAEWGLFGDELEEFFGKIGEYDKTNYNVVPLGWDGDGDDRKAVYLRLPQDETGRLLGGMLWKMLQAPKEGVKSVPQVLDFGAGMFPGISPILAIGWEWAQFITGGEPTDSFTGRPILSRDESAVGGLPATKKMMEWTLEQGGVLKDLMRVASYEGEGGLDFALKLPVGVTSFIRSTNFGDVEREWKAQDAEDKQRAEFRMSLPDEALKLSTEFGRLARKGDRRTDSEDKRYKTLRFFNRYYLNKREQIQNAERKGDRARAKELRGELRERAVQNSL